MTSQLELIEISQDGTYAHSGLVSTSPSLNWVLEATRSFYAATGYSPPWISYLAVSGKDIVGTAAYKGAPKEGRVEIAYFTFPEYEGRGIATQMVEKLIQLAFATDPNINVTARTLKERNASHRVLEKSGFNASGHVFAPEDGEVLEWVFPQPKQ